MAAAASARPAPEMGPRAALLVWGGAPLVVGLALVGVGAEEEGAALALAGLFNVIYGIHTFGRLGPDDAEDEAGAADAARAAASSAVWTGALTLAAGLVVVIDGYFVRRLPLGSWAAVPLAVTAVGLLRLQQGAAARRAAQRAAAKVEKKRRLGHRRAP
jgi:hypothetical protein